MATDDDEAMADLGLATMNLAELRRVLDAIPAEVFGLPECQTANRFHRRMVSLLEARTLRLNARRAAAGADHVTFRDPTSTLAGTPKRHSDADGSGRGRRGSLP